MTYLHATIPVAGIQLDTFVTPDDRVFVTLTSIAQGVGVHRQTVKNWLTRDATPVSDTIKVDVGIRKKEATAYPVVMAVEFLKFIAGKGNKEAQALLDAIVIADLERSAREANGIQVTAEQHEENRHLTRLAILEQWVSENYKPVRAKDGTINVLKGETIRAAGLDKNPTEYTIVNLLSQIAKRETQMGSGKMTEEELEMYREGNRRYQTDIQKLSLSLT